MEILNFVLGMFTIIFIGMIVGIFMMARNIKYLKQNINDIWNGLNDAHRRIAEVSELDNRRIDGEIDRTNHLIDDVYRAIDSRLDKLENKLTNNK
jgi:ribosome-associated translation inhibitor RaiA